MLLSHGEDPAINDLHSLRALNRYMDEPASLPIHCGAPQMRVKKSRKPSPMGEDTNVVTLLRPERGRLIYVRALQMGHLSMARLYRIPD